MSNRRSPIQRTLALALSLSLAVALNGCERFKSADSLYRDAEARYQKGEQKAVIIQLKAALQKDPKHGPSRLLSAKAYNDTGDFVAAEKEARKALELGVNADQAGLELARSLAGQGQFQKALDAAKLSPGLSGEALAKVLVVRGDAQIALRQIEAAKESYAAAVKAAPDYYGGYLGQARLAAAKNDAAEAARQIDLVLQKSPQLLEGLIIKGDLLAAQGKKDQAVAAYQAAAKANPSRGVPHFRLASIYLAENKPDEVTKEVQAGQKVEPGNLEGRYLLARNDFQQKKYSDARANIQAVLRSAPDHMPSLLLAGAISAALGETESAENNLNRVINAFPNNSYARSLLASTYLTKGQADSALAVLMPVLQVAQPEGQVLALAGQAYLAKGDMARATEMFERARIENPQSAAIRTRLGAARLVAGDSEHAIADLEAASAMDAKDSNADMVLILNYLQHKDYDKALAAIAVLEKKQPDSPVPMNLRGGVNLAKGDIPAARASFEQAVAMKADYLPAVQNLVQLDLRDKNVAAARKRYEAVLAKDKQSVGAMLGMAQLAAIDKNEKEYGDWLNKAVVVKPDAIEPRAMLADLYLKQKKPQDALRLANEALAANPNNARALELLARVQFAAGDKDSGLLSYQKLAQQNPKSAPAYFGLGQAEAAVNHMEEARSAWRKALQLQPSYVEAAAALTALEVQQQRTEAALKVARDFQSANPKLAAGFVLESDVLAQQRKFDPAIQLLNKAQSVQAQSQIAIRTHQLQMAAKRPADADAGLRQWISAHPNDMPPRMYLAESLLARKQNKAAIEQYEAVLKAYPDNVLALNNLAAAYQMEKDSRALATAEHAYKLQPDSPQIADTLGWILLDQGQLARGVDILRKAAAAAPKIGEIGYHYAVALAKNGDKAAARKQLEATLAAGGTFPSQEQAKALLKQLTS
jgi:putative PEP-CTERM system TPR-repeat lipoprotein